MQSDSVENIFARSWSLLAKNPTIVVPGLVVGIAVGIIEALLTPQSHGSDSIDPANAGRAIAGGLSAVAAAGLTFAVTVLAFLVNQTYTTGMAGAAWQTGRTSIADGAASFREDAGRLLGTVLLIGVIGIAVALLTFGVGWFIVLFFALYAVPAVVLDNYGALTAVKLSARIATRRLLSTIIIIVMLVVIAIGVSLLALPFAIVPFIGPIVLAIVSQAVTAYATLVVVGEYLQARRAPDIAGAGPLS